MTPNENVSILLCEAKHGEVMRELKHFGKKLDDVIIILTGTNGHPGLRETQQDVQRLREAFGQRAARSETWIMFLLRPLWPVAIGLLFFGLLQAARSGHLPM